MSIAEKLTTIAENEQKVYNKGYETGKADEEYTWWGIITGKGAKQQYPQAFEDTDFMGKDFNPPYLIKPTYAMRIFFRAKNIPKLYTHNLDLSLLPSTNLTYCFCQLSATKEILGSLDLRKGGIADYMFADSFVLETIEKIILSDDGTSPISTASPFHRCWALEEIRFEGKIGTSISFDTCIKLSKDSIISIINALYENSTGQTLTLNQTAVTNAFGSTDAQEWLDLIATKSNWTISLA